VIIDIHAHLWGEEIPSKEWWDTFVKISASMSGRPEEKVREKLPGWWDLSGDLLVKDMDEGGVDKAIILTVDSSIYSGTGEVISLEKMHQITAAAVRRHPTRLAGFLGIDPRRPGAAKFLERAVKEWDMKGLKLHPTFGFYPNDNCCYLLYSKAQELGIPVIFHTGPELIPNYSKYANPLYLDEVANDFPDLTIIMAHAGGCYWPEAASLVSCKPNLFIDLAWWQPKILRNPVDEFYKPLRSILNTVGPSKTLFGSDWPALRMVRKLSYQNWIKAFKEPPEEVKAAGVQFTEEEINGILGQNAARILKM
jgi:predicted TIM-barrel fold metal-dependent hydrolase